VRDLFRADEKRRVAIQEARPVLLAVARRRLVGDQRVAARNRRAVHELVDEVFADDGLAAGARARIAQEAVEEIDALLLVDGIDRQAEVGAPGRQQPLPVAEVRRQQHHGLPRLAGGSRRRRGSRTSRASRSLLRRAEAPHRFHHDVRDVAVRLLQDARALVGRLLGESARDVARHLLAPPAEDVKTGRRR
jgi:hypothetical protein